MLFLRRIFVLSGQNLSASWVTRTEIQNRKSIDKPVAIHESSLGLGAAPCQAIRADFDLKLESQACLSFSALQGGDPCQARSSGLGFLAPHFLFGW